MWLSLWGLGKGWDLIQYFFYHDITNKPLSFQCTPPPPPHTHLIIYTHTQTQANTISHVCTHALIPYAHMENSITHTYAYTPIPSTYTHLNTITHVAHVYPSFIYIA